MRNPFLAIGISAITCMLLSQSVFSQTRLKEKWSACYQKDSSYTFINDMAADSAGNVYSTGYYLNGSGSKKFFATKANEKGVQQWVRFYPVEEPDTSQVGMHVIADDKGNVWVIGKRYDIEFSPCTTYARLSVFCIRYNQNGDLMYHTVAERQEGTELSTSVCYDNKENVYLVIRVENCYRPYSKAIGLDKKGSIKWGNSFFDEPYSVNDAAIDNNGDIIITGMLISPPISARADNVNQLIIKKLDTKKGKVIWENSFEGTGVYSSSSGYDVAVNKLNDIYVYGIINDTAALFKYTASGKLAWYKKETIRSPGISETNRALAIDEKNNAYILSYIWQYALPDYQWMISKYTTNGKKDWSVLFDTLSTNFRHPAAIIYTNGNIYTTGESYTNGAYRYTTIQFNKDGKQKGIYFYGKKTEQSHAICLAADAAGNIYVAGNSGERVCIVQLGDKTFTDTPSFIF